MSSVLRRTLVGLGLALGVALLLALHRYPATEGVVLWLGAAVLSCMGANEAARMSGAEDASLVLLVPGVVLALATFPFAGPVLDFERGRDVYPLAALAVALLAGALALVSSKRRAGGRSLPPARAAGLALWILPPLYGLLWVDAHLWTAGLAFLIVVSKVGDVFGYFVGRSIGKRHPFPYISPNKTVAGCVASLCAATAAGAALAAFELPVSWRTGQAGGALAGLALNLAAQGGDLLESLVKRRYGVKDSGTLFGPSGGVLDVVDSLLLSIPLALVLLPNVL